MKILGINISHDVSIGQIDKGKIELYQEEKKILNLDKFSFRFPLEDNLRLKCIEKFVKEQPNYVIYSSYDRSNLDGTNYGDIAIIHKLQKQLNNSNFLFFRKNHHVYHAFNAFHLSNYDEALCIVLDGGGAQLFPSFQEIESIFYLNQNEYRYLHQHLSNIRSCKGKTNNNKIFKNINGVEIELSTKISSGMKFSDFVDFVMKTEKKYDDKISMKSVIREMMELYHYGNEKGNRLEDKIRQLHIETKNETIKFIEKALNYYDCKNIVLSGGYALNYINNEEYKKYFSDYNFFFDPWAHDGGTAPGAALWLDFHLNKLNIPFEELEKRQNEVFGSCRIST
jgi:predicted NodU family carbamoyl transferase